MNRELLRLGIAASRAGWIQSTYITPDTEAMAAQANEALLAAATAVRRRRRRASTACSCPPHDRRQLDVLKNSLTVAAPPDPKEAEELTRLVASMEGAYGRAQVLPARRAGEDCLDIEEITEILAENRDPTAAPRRVGGLAHAAVPMRKDYARFVELSNKGAKELGFADTGAMWRSELRHAAGRVRRRSSIGCGSSCGRSTCRCTPTCGRSCARSTATSSRTKGPIPAHLLGNMWAQDWSTSIRSSRRPARGQPFSLDRHPEGAEGRRRSRWCSIGERFFTSLGFDPLPKTFWERSLFVKPRDREVVCHASAWDIDNVDDLRIKMCIDLTAEDFTTIHHELGHNFYQRAYNTQPVLFRDSANDGFHEAVGDTIALSVTPEYLVKIGLLDKAPDAVGRHRRCC